MIPTLKGKARRPPLSNGYDVRLLRICDLEVVGSSPTGGLTQRNFYFTLALNPLCATANGHPLGKAVPNLPDE